MPAGGRNWRAKGTERGARACSCSFELADPVEREQAKFGEPRLFSLSSSTPPHLLLSAFSAIASRSRGKRNSSCVAMRVELGQKAGRTGRNAGTAFASGERKGRTFEVVALQRQERPPTAKKTKPGELIVLRDSLWARGARAPDAFDPTFAARKEPSTSGLVSTPREKEGTTQLATEIAKWRNGISRSFDFFQPPFQPLDLSLSPAFFFFSPSSHSPSSSSPLPSLSLLLPPLASQPNSTLSRSSPPASRRPATASSRSRTPRRSPTP